MVHQKLFFAADKSMMNADAGADMIRSSGDGSPNQLKDLAASA